MQTALAREWLFYPHDRDSVEEYRTRGLPVQSVRKDPRHRARADDEVAGPECGHIGLFMVARTRPLVWPEVAAWIREHEPKLQWVSLTLRSVTGTVRESPHAGDAAFA